MPTVAARKKIRLSHSGLEGLERCPRCFWLQYRRGIYQPEGIVSRLANRFDVLTKRYFDAYRGTDELPPLVRGKVDGVLEQPFQEVYSVNFGDGYEFYGKLDECLVTQEGKRTPVDHKTSSSDPRKEREVVPGERGLQDVYQDQLNAYAYLMEMNNKSTSGIGHLIYYYPDESKNLHEGMDLAVIVKTLSTDPTSVPFRIERGIEAIEGAMPDPSPDCPFCRWRASLDKL